MITSVLMLFVVLAGSDSVTEFQLEKIYDIHSIELLQQIADNYKYPMPWLAEILSDSTIPEIDRYWLDCRIRAVFARDIHLFFNREGEGVYIEADFIKPGEAYWRENFIVNPVGEPFEYSDSTLPTAINSEPGVILNRYGERIGDIATSNWGLIFLSRDASVGISRSGNGLFALDYACFLYPDGTFREVDIDDVSVLYILSEDGNTAVYYSREQHNPGSNERMLSVFDKQGDLRFERLMSFGSHSGSARLAVSIDGRYIATGMWNGSICLLDAFSGAMIHLWGDSTMRMSSGCLSFSPNGSYLCASEGSARVFDCTSGEVVWELLAYEEGTPGTLPHTYVGYDGLSTTNDASLFGLIRCVGSDNGLRYNQRSYSTQVYTKSGEILLNYLDGGIPWFSPSGCILFLDHTIGIEGGSFSTPIVIIRISQAQTNS